MRGMQNKVPFFKGKDKDREGWKKEKTTAALSSSARCAWDVRVERQREMCRALWGGFSVRCGKESGLLFLGKYKL